MSTIEEQIRDAEGRLFARYDLSVTEHLPPRVLGSKTSREFVIPGPIGPRSPA